VTKKNYSRRSIGKTTVCELLRMILDECQTDSEKDTKIRGLLTECVRYAKKMNAKLTEYKRDYDAGWWKRLPKEEKKRLNKIRTSVGYKELED